MMINTMEGVPMDAHMFKNYIRNLVNAFFKILPIWESGDVSVTPYIDSLKVELIGCSSLIAILHDDPSFISLISILQYLADNHDIEHHIVKREVFKAISICNKLQSKYCYVDEEVL